MDELLERVNQAHRRMLLNEWLGRVVTCLWITFGVALGAVSVPKMIPVDGLPAWWGNAWLAGAAVAGIVAASLWSLVRQTPRDEAAAEIDRRYDLCERTASSLLLDQDERATEAGAALIEDASRAIHQVELSERFGLSPGRRAWLPLLPALASFLLIALVGNQTAESRPKAPSEEVTETQVNEALEKSRKRLAERRKQAEQRGLKDASGLLKEIEAGTKDLAKQAKKDRTQAVVKLNDLAKQLEKRKKELGSAEALRKQMNQMKDLGAGPAEKGAKAMQQGDWKKAAEEMAKLQRELASGKVSPEKREQLAAQLGKMSEQLAKATERQKQQEAELKRQLEAAQRKGDLQQAGKLQQKLDQMKMQAPMQHKMGLMQQQMAQAQQAIQQGNPKQAADAMQQMQQQMQQMQQETDAMEMLDAAMTDIMGAKEGMGMQASPGAQGGMAQGGGRGKGEGQGPGMGEGRGGGNRPDEKNPTRFRDSSVKQNVGRGASTFGGLVRGPSIKGEVTAQVKQELDATSVAPADPLTSERLPRSRREHAEEYFRKLREEL